MHFTALMTLLASASTALATGRATVINDCESKKYVSVTRAGPGQTANTFSVDSKRSWGEAYQGTGNSIGITNGPDVSELSLPLFSLRLECEKTNRRGIVLFTGRAEADLGLFGAGPACLLERQHRLWRSADPVQGRRYGRMSGNKRAQRRSDAHLYKRPKHYVDSLPLGVKELLPRNSDARCANLRENSTWESGVSERCGTCRALSSVFNVLSSFFFAFLFVKLGSLYPWLPLFTWKDVAYAPLIKLHK